jgi:hypothetical protein
VIDDAPVSTAAEPDPAAGGDNRGRDSLVDFLSRLVIALAIYIGSIGPMYWPWHQAKFLNGYWIIAALYEPLYLVAGWIPPFGRWLNWYVLLWIR